MNALAQRLKKASRLYGRTAAFGASTVAIFFRWHLTQPQASREAYRAEWLRNWAKVQLKILDAELLGDTNLRDYPGPTLVLCNHRSAIDIVAMTQIFAPHMVSRDDIARWPFLGYAAKALGTIFVDRQNARSGAQAVRAMEESLTRGETVCIFPEGTTFVGDEVRPLKGGAVKAAMRTGARIIPVGIAYDPRSDAAYFGTTFGVHLSKVAQADLIRAAIVVGPPIELGPGASEPAARDQIRSVMQSLVAQARAQLGEARP
jgi:lyso-ornithine lipid O-acyltransferase